MRLKDSKDKAHLSKQLVLKIINIRRPLIKVTRMLVNMKIKITEAQSLIKVVKMKWTILIKIAIALLCKSKLVLIKSIIMI